MTDSRKNKILFDSSFLRELRKSKLCIFIYFSHFISLHWKNKLLEFNANKQTNESKI